MRNRINKAVVLLAAPDLAHQENRIHHHPGNQQREENNPKEQKHPFAPIQDDPSHIERNREGDQANPQDDEEHNRSAAARDAHENVVILPRPN